MEKESIIKPIPLWQSILLFGIPGLVLYVGLYYGVPIFSKIGLPDIFLFPFFLWIGLIPLLPISIIAFKREQKNHSNLSFKNRFRLKKLTGKDWLWVVGGILFVMVFDFVIMDPVSKWMATLPVFSPPDHFPVIFNPLKEIEFPLTHFLGVSLKGNWLFLFVIHSTKDKKYMGIFISSWYSKYNSMDYFPYRNTRNRIILALMKNEIK